MGKRRAVLGVVIVCLAAGTVESREPVYREGFRGPSWLQWPYPDPRSVGENCHGNCGAGCSDNWDPCFSPPQYWVQEMLDEPQLLGIGHGLRTECDVTSGTLYFYDAFIYGVPMRETYHGFQTLACKMHDATCGDNPLLDPGCWWPPDAFCPFERGRREWSYVAARQTWWWEPGEVVEGGCEVCPGGPPCYY